MWWIEWKSPIWIIVYIVCLFNCIIVLVCLCYLWGLNNVSYKNHLWLIRIAIFESCSDISSSSGNPRVEYPICYCDVKACGKTIHIEDNEGRRFFGSQNYMVKFIVFLPILHVFGVFIAYMYCFIFQTGNSCGFFCWYDPELPTYGQKTIKRLWQTIDKSKAEINDIQTTRHQLDIVS